MPVLSFRVVRPNDLLIAEFELHGFELPPPVANEPRTLVRVQGEEGRLIVLLPPQSFGELSFETDVVPDPALKQPIIAATRARLAFLIPDSIETLPFTLESFLNWEAFQPIVVPRDEIPRPPLHETSLEMPCRVFLNPTETSRWEHEPAPAPDAERFALWSTLLIGGSGIIRGFRVVWSPDLTTPLVGFNLPLRPSHRAALASTGHVLTPQRLALSALGGDLQIDVRVGTGGGPDGLGLVHWEHNLALGRDMRVRAESRGILYPWQHAATRTDFTERIFRVNSDRDRSAVLIQKTFITVVEVERLYTTREWPFRSIKIAATTIETSVAEFTVFRVPVVATDWSGRELKFHAPALFVESADPATLNRAAEAYQSQVVAFEGEPVTYVRPLPGFDGATFPTKSLGIKAEHLPDEDGGFRPKLTQATVWLEAVQSIGSQLREPVTFSYNPDFFDQDLSADPSGRFANLERPLKLAASSRQFGGIAVPEVNVNALTLKQGISFAPQVPSPSPLPFPLDGKLLGVFRLSDLLPFDDVESVPKLVTTVGDDREMRFTCSAKLGSEGRLSLSAVLPLSGTRKYEISGTLTNFNLELDILTLRFIKLSFRQTQGQSPRIEDVNATLKFAGDLRFVAAIAEHLAKAAPGTPPGTRVVITPAGLLATFSATLPKIPMGQFTLMNLSLSASLQLKFDAAMEMEFALASRDKPFLVSYSAFGGGGYFRLVLGPEGPKLVEFSIQLGAIVEVDFIVARGSAQVLIGFAITQRLGLTRLEGSVRIYGAVEVLQLVTVSIDVVLSLRYEHPIATGTVAVTIEIHVLAFSRSVSFSITRSFDTGVSPGDVIASGGTERSRRLQPAPSRFADTVNMEGWSRYCNAFAE